MEPRASFWQRLSGKSNSSSDSPPPSRQSRVTTSAGGRRGSKGKSVTVAPPTTVYNKRSLLHDYLIKSHEEPHLESVSQLGRLCLHDSETCGIIHGGNDLIYCAALLLEWSSSRGDELTALNYRKLAGAHYEAWKTRGVIGEVDHLKYAKVSYEKALKNPEISSSPLVWLEYSKVLMHLGEAELGLKTITSMIRLFDSDEDNQGIFYLTAGAMLSSIGKHEQAGQYYFEAIQLGAPKFFTKSDLMFILSRSFEQLGFETKASGTDPVEEGYIMVFSHMVSEKSEESSVTYQDWISSYETWRDIGDKCAMHGLFSLAADLYGQGLVRDKRAFLRSSLWFKFAKSCFRCGRTSDAQLAVKQAVTLDPQNTQCLLALRTWSTISTVVLDLVEGPLLPILQLLPAERSPLEVAACVIQAFYRGQSLRWCGRGRVKLTPTIRRKILKSFSATTTVMIGEGDAMYPLLLTVRPTWKGEINRIKMFNIKTDSVGMLVLKTPFRLPLSMYDPSYSYSVTISCSRLQLSSDSPLDESDSEMDDIPTNNCLPGDESPNIYLIVIKYSEKESGFYILRQLYLLLGEDGALSTIETSIDTYCSRFHNLSQLDLPPYCEESTQMTDIATDGPSIEDPEDLTNEQQSSIDDLHAESTIEVEDATMSQWEPTVVGEDSSTSVESIMSLFTPYRPRRGIYRHFGTLYLYNATFISNSQNSEVVSTPSAKAMHEANRLSGYRNTLQLRCLQVNTGRRMLFILPPRLAVMENLDDVFPILLGSVQEVSFISIEEAGDSDIVLTPRRHGVSLLGGALFLLVKATESVDGEIVVRLAIPQPRILSDGDEFSVQSEAEFIDSVRKVLTVHKNKNQAWNQLQDHVCKSLDYELESSAEELGDIRENSGSNIDEVNLTTDKLFSRGGIKVGDHYFLYRVRYETVDVKKMLTINLQRLPENETVVFFLAPRRSSLDHIDILLQILALRFSAFISAGSLSIITSEDDSDDDRSYLDAVREFLNPLPEITSSDVSRELVESWLSAVCAKLLPSKISSRGDQNPPLGENEERKELELKEKQREEQQKQYLKDIQLRIEQEQLKLNNENTRKAEIKCSAESTVSVALKSALDRLLSKFDDDVRYLRKGLTLDVVSNILQSGFQDASKYHIKKRSIEEVLLPSGPKLSVPGLDTTFKEISTLPSISISDLLNPLEDTPELDMFLSPPDEPEKGSLMVPSVNVQAAFFLAFQEQRLSCLDYLADRAAKAKHYVARLRAFEFLKDRVKIARAKLDNRQPESTRKQSTAPKKKVAMNESPTEIITDIQIDEKPEESPLSSKESRKVTRQHSAPHLKEKINKEKRRGTLPTVITGKSSPNPPEDTVPPSSAQQLHTLLDLQLKDETFTEHPQVLVEALQSLSTDIPSVCASPRFMALSQRTLPSRDESPGRPHSIESEKNDTTNSPNEKSPLRRSPSVLTTFPPNKISEWDSKIEIMKSANGLAPIGMGKRNPIDFLDESLVDPYCSSPMFEESISNYLQKGYSTGTCAYLAIWKNKIIHCVKSFPSPNHLDKAIYSLQRAYPEPLTRAGALCALSETNGSVGEALGQLNDKTFKHELVLVCQALPLDEIVNRLTEYKKQQKINSSEKSIDDLLFDTQIMRNNQGYSSEIASPDPISFLDESPRTLQISEFRFPTDISRSMPHHGMMSTSPTVLSRGNLVKRTRDNVKSATTLGTLDTEQVHLPPIGRATLSKSMNSLPTKDEQSNARSSFVTNYKHKKSTKHHDITNSSKFLHTGTAPPKFTRVGKTIDILAEQSDTVVVMSRINAYRAQEEELLLKYHPEQQSYYRTSKQKKFQGKLSPVEF